MALIEKLTAIADAIRGKTGKTDGLTLDQMPGEIAGIQSGGDTSIEDSFVNHSLTSYSNDRITELVNYAFYRFGSLTYVSFPNVTTVGSYAFENSGLNKCSFPNVTTFKNYAFTRCQFERITNEDFPKLVGIGADYSFSSCTKLRYFQRNHVKIGYNKRTFSGCSALEKADINAGSLGYNTFNGCPLTALILRNKDSITNLQSASAENLGKSIYNGTGFIYVPRTMDDGSDGVAAYRAATNWSSLLPEQFRAIEDYPEICEVGV